MCVKSKWYPNKIEEEDRENSIKWTPFVLVEASPGHQQSLGSVHPGAGLRCSTGCVCTNELNQELCMVVFDGKSVPKSSMLHHLLLGVKKLLTA